MRRSGLYTPYIRQLHTNFASKCALRMLMSSECPVFSEANGKIPLLQVALNVCTHFFCLVLLAGACHTPTYTSERPTGAQHAPVLPLPSTRKHTRTRMGENHQSHREGTKVKKSLDKERNDKESKMCYKRTMGLFN